MTQNVQYTGSQYQYWITDWTVMGLPAGTSAYWGPENSYIASVTDEQAAYLLTRRDFTTPTGSSALTGEYIKEMPLGLMDRWQNPTTSNATFGPFVFSQIVQFDWKDMQLVAGGPLSDFNNVPTAISNTTYGPSLRAVLDAAALAGRKVALRPMGGIAAPAWVKNIGGTPLVWDQGRTCCRFWHPEVLAADEYYQKLLQEVFDDDPVVAKIMIAGSMTEFTELFLLQAGEAEVKTSLMGTSGEAFPYNKAAHLAAIKKSIDNHRVWKHTVSSLALSPMHTVTSTTTAVVDDTESTKTMARYARATLGERLELNNYCIRSPHQDDVLMGGTGGDMVFYVQQYLEDLYPFMASMGGRIGFQTDARARVGLLAEDVLTPLSYKLVQWHANDGGPRYILGGSTLAMVLHYGGSSVELPGGYHTTSTSTTAQKFSSTAVAALWDAAIREKAALPDPSEVTENRLQALEASDRLLLSVGEEFIGPRSRWSSTTLAPSTSGRMHFVFGTARKTELVANVEVASGGVAAAGTTLARIGVYEEAADGSLTLVASTANDTALLNTVTSVFTRAVTTPFLKVRGRRYAIGLLVVAATTMPTLSGAAALSGPGGVWAARKPRLTGYLAAQADLPASVAAGALTNSTVPFAAVMLP